MPLLVVLIYVRTFVFLSPIQPGRVLTLAEKMNATTWGTAIKVHRESIPSIDHRETGYVRKKTLFYPFHPSGMVEPFEVEVYIAKEDNPHYLGPASLQDLAQDIAFSKGESGCNAEYLLALCDFLSKHEIMSMDSHLSELEGKVKALLHHSTHLDLEGLSSFACNCVYHRAYLSNVPPKEESVMQAKSESLLAL